MRALSDAQLRAAIDGGVPDPELLERAPGADGELWSVPVPMPGGHLAYTLSAVHLGPSGAVSIVDPGWDTEEGLELLEALLGRLGGGLGAIETIVVTHAHPDHLGAAEALRGASGARLLMHEREQAAIDRARLGAGSGLRARAEEWGAPADAADRLVEQREAAARAARLPAPADGLLRDGDRLPIPGLDWEVLWTPGHTSGHICLIDRAGGRILTGDHVLPTVFPGIGIGVDAMAGAATGDPVAEYLGSLRRLEPFDGFEALPGHGYRFRGLGARRRETERHVLARAREVAEQAAAGGGVSVWELASRLTWTGGWQRLAAGPMLASALTQVGHYLDFARAGGLSDPSSASPGARS